MTLPRLPWFGMGAGRRTDELSYDSMHIAVEKGARAELLNNITQIATL